MSDEYDDSYREHVFGSLASLLDVGDILERATGREIERTEDRIADALERARRAHSLQEELLDGARRYDPTAAPTELSITMSHVDAFVRGMLPLLGCELRGTAWSEQVLEVVLSDDVRALLHRNAARCRLTTSREIADRIENVEMMDASHPLLRHMLQVAQRHDFGGVYARIGGLPGVSMMCAALLRWQSDQGRLLRDELLAAVIADDGGVALNSPEVSNWLLEPAADGCEAGEREGRIRLGRAAERAIDAHLAGGSSDRLHPAQRWLFAAARSDRNDVVDRSPSTSDSRDSALR